MASNQQLSQSSTPLASTSRIPIPLPTIVARPTTRTTKFSLPPPPPKRESAPDTASSPPSGATVKPTNSILNRLGRRLSQSKTQLVRRVSLGSRSSAFQQSAPMVVSASASGITTPTGPHEEAVVERGTRGLARSKSEGTATPKRSRAIQVGTTAALDIIYGRNAARKEGEKAVREREKEGQGRMYWEERLGICWDGREQVHPDFTDSFVHYSSNSDQIAPAAKYSPPRVVYASTLSTFPPRPPLRSRLSMDSPPTTLSPASQIIAEYRSRYGPVTETNVDENDGQTTTSTSASLTPIPTPIAARSRTHSLRSLARPPSKREEGAAARQEPTPAPLEYDSDVSSTSSLPRFARGSEDSSTSLESMDEDSTKAVTPVIRFALVDEGPVPASSQPTQVTLVPNSSSSPGIKQPRGRRASFVTASEGSEGPVLGEEGEDWRECE